MSRGSELNGLGMRFGSFTLSAVSSTVICLAVGFWLGPPLPLSPAPRRLAEQRMLQALEEPSALDVQSVPLRDAIRQLASRHGIRIMLDRGALGDVGLWGNEPVTHKVSGIRLGSVLRLLLKDLGLDFCVHDGEIVITTSDAMCGPRYLVGAVYPMVPPAIGSRSSGENDIAHLIRSEVEPTEWFGGPGEMRVIPGALVVIQRSQTHRDIELALQQLERLREYSDSTCPVSLWPDCRSDMEKHIATALEQTTGLDFDDASLADVCRTLRERFAIPIEIDDKALQDVGVGVDVPVTVHVRDVTLETGLRLMLRDLDLTCDVRGDVLLIMTPECADWQFSRVYPISDLIGYGDDNAGYRLVELVTTVVHPVVWGFAGGPFTARLLDSQFLIVSADPEIHAEVETFLGELRRALDDRASRMDHIGISPTTRKIECALKERVSLEFQEARVSDIVEWVMGKWEVNVRLDRHVVDDPTVQIDKPISCNLPDVTLEDGLRQLLATSGMDIVVRDDILWFVRPDDRAWERPNRWYNIRGIVDPDLGLLDPRALVEVILRAIGNYEVSGDTHALWGDATVYRGMLIVSETRDNHKAIARILGYLTNNAERLRHELRSADLPRESVMERLLREIRTHVVPLPDVDNGIEDHTKASTVETRPGEPP